MVAISQGLRPTGTLSLANPIAAQLESIDFGAEQRSTEDGYNPFRAGWPRFVYIRILLAAGRNVRPRQRRHRRSSRPAVDRRPGTSGQESDSGSGKRDRPSLRIINCE